MQNANVEFVYSICYFVLHTLTSTCHCDLLTIKIRVKSLSSSKTLQNVIMEKCSQVLPKTTSGATSGNALDDKLVSNLFQAHPLRFFGLK